MDLFSYQNIQNAKKQAPLSNRIRPKTLEEFVGQQDIISKDSILYKAITKDMLSSLIFYGPSGTGKTTLAKIIANLTKSEFVTLNAVLVGSKDIKQVIDNAKALQKLNNKKTILFIDEIHAFNKKQQDILLPFIEDGTIILIGATTENPYFEINKAIISRSLIYKFEPLSKEDIKKVLVRAIEDDENGISKLNIEIDDIALDYLAKISDGDCRIALNTLELLANTLQDKKISVEEIQKCINTIHIKYDKNGDNHYDNISAFIKSMRGSDPDASVYYLARMLYAGEDPEFIARRLIICASEDVGNADPRALQVAVSAFEATRMIGMPECRIVLAQATTYIASAPKSNASYLAIKKAMQDVKDTSIKTVPLHIKDSHYDGAKDFGNGMLYKYPHDFQKNYVKQQYLPEELKDKKYYFPTDNGYEKNIKKWLDYLKEIDN